MINGLALLAAVSAFAAEQAPAQKFEAVAAPELELQPTDLDKKTPAESAPPPAGDPTPEWWGELQQGLDKELNNAGPGPSAGAGTDSASGQAGAASPGRSAGMSLLRGIAALCVVVALILVCYYVANRYGRKSPLFAGSSLGRIVGRVHLSPKAELYFVRVRDRMLVLGVTPNEVSRVAEFDAAMFEDAQPAAAPVGAPVAPQSAFARELRAQTLPEPTASAVSDELAALKAELDKARQYFRETSGEPGAL